MQRICLSNLLFRLFVVCQALGVQVRFTPADPPQARVDVVFLHLGSTC